jgi:iron(III) transport system substrate-binding protein
VNVAGAGILRTTDRADVAQQLVDYLLGPGQEYFAAETYEYPLVEGVAPGSELPPLSDLQGPDLELGVFGEELAATLELLDSVGLTS